MVWLGWVLRHINHCRLFNAKSYSYIYIKYMVCKHILLITFLNKPQLTCLPTVKWFQVLLCNSNNLTLVICLHPFKWIYIGFVNQQLSIILFLNELELICLHISFSVVCRQLNGFSNCYLTLITLFNINLLFADREVVTSIAIQDYSFLRKQMVPSIAM